VLHSVLLTCGALVVRLVGGMVATARGPTNARSPELPVATLHPDSLKRRSRLHTPRMSSRSPRVYERDNNDYLAPFSSKSPLWSNHRTRTRNMRFRQSPAEGALPLRPQRIHRGQSSNFQKTPTISHSTRTAARASRIGSSLRASDLVIDGHGATLNFSDLCVPRPQSSRRPNPWH
jgi:hypothetical protein